MSYASLNGERVISGQIILPYYGIWTADVVLAVSIKPADPMILTIGNLTLTGSHYRSLAFGGSRGFRIIGGAGGWRKQVKARYYKSPVGVLRSTILNDAASEVGEHVSLAEDASVGDAFVRQSGHASLLLEQVAQPLWWMRPDGVTYVGPRTARTIASAFQTTATRGASGSVEVATEDVAAWMPGAKFTPPSVGQELTISTVVHSMQDGVVRTEVLVP